MRTKKIKNDMKSETFSKSDTLEQQIHVDHNDSTNNSANIDNNVSNPTIAIEE